MEKLKDLSKGICFGIWYSQHHIIHSFIKIPLGILVLFAILYGFNVLLSDILKIEFPASVLGMLVNLVFLCILSSISSLDTMVLTSQRNWKQKFGSGCHWVLEHYLLIIKPLMNFTLKWINVFFIPSFIILPLSDPITIIECLKIAAVFLIGGLFLMIFDVYMIMLLKVILTKLGIYSFNVDKADNELYYSKHNDEEIELFDLNRPYIQARDDITTIDVTTLRPTKTEPTQNVKEPGSIDIPFEESEARPDFKRILTSPVAPMMTVKLLDHARTSAGGEEDRVPTEASHEISSTKRFDLHHLSPLAQKTTIFITNYVDWFLYLALFIISLPFYYIRSIHVMLPYHLGLTVVAYYVALLIPIRWPLSKKFAHPILILTAEILFICFIGSLIYHKGSPKGFLEDLRFYKTGKNYLKLFDGKALWDNGTPVPERVLDEHITSEPLWPGCGDILSSLMDISIVSLSLPMFTHRKDFIKNFWILMPPLLVSMVLTFFCYPIICYRIGISAERSIGFIGRLVTLALGTPLITSLGGSVSLMAVCTILSGICGVLVGDQFFSLLRIPSNDFVTRGVTLGINCGAIATAHLLNVDPRAASMSSLSFSVFGTIMIILASVGAVRELIRSWVGM